MSYQNFLEIAALAPANSDLDRAYKSAISEVDKLTAKVGKLEEENSKLKESKKSAKASSKPKAETTT